MSIQTVIDDYSRQFVWRPWPIVFDAMPNCDGKTVLDLGCGNGDLAFQLAMRGASVIGVDANEDFLQFARSRSIKNAEFRAADLRTFTEPNLQVDGIWSSFTAAYFPSFDETLSAWSSCLRPGGWIVLTEIDDLFGHEPLSERTQLLLNEYARDSLSNSRYDFHMGRKMVSAVRQAGFVVAKELTLPDAELSFTGTARADVIAAWRTRFDRMNVLRCFCGAEMETVRDDFLNCLAREDHRCSANVICVIAIKRNFNEKLSVEPSVRRWESQMAAGGFAGLAFTDELLTRPPVSGRDAQVTLEHFAIVSYAVPAERVRPHVHSAFDLDCFPGPDGGSLVWVSLVPFEDQDFRFVANPWLRFRFGQTNYRTYVVERSAGRRAVWFFGTTLDSWAVIVPRYVWKLPWHRGRVRFDCDYDALARRYARYRMTTRCAWAPVELELEDSGAPATALEGLPDLEAGLVALTHPLTGVYYRRDGHLGTYRIWHDRLRCNAGRVLHARLGLFDRLGVVPYAEQLRPHSVLIQHRTEFTIYLPPGRYSSGESVERTVGLERANTVFSIGKLPPHAQ